MSKLLSCSSSCGLRSLLQSPSTSVSLIQKAFLKNPLPAVTIKGASARNNDVGKDASEKQRFPDNLSWPEEIQWMNIGAHKKACKPYQPPADVEDQIREIWRSVVGSDDVNTSSPIGDLSTKFKLLTTCADQLGHSVPNSQLHQVCTFKDIISFYTAPVNTSTPLENLREQELPSNLHILMENERFHPETDTRFGGISAFPRSSTVVSGLEARKKYKGYDAKKSWPFK